ncbi:MAG: EI24 domain-containing protein [Bacteroidota bacterium]
MTKINKRSILFRGFALGLQSFFEAIVFIFRHRLYYFFVFPIILSITLVILSTIGGFALIQTMVDWLELKVVGYLPEGHPSESIPDFGWDWFAYMWEKAKEGFSSGFTWIAALALKVVFFFITSFLMKYIVLAFMSPILAWLSEKTENKLTGNDYPFKLDQFVRDVWRGILISIRNFAIESALMVLFWFIFLVLGFIFPPISFLGWIALFILSSYYYGYAMIDYVNERRRLSISEGSRFIRKYSGMAIALGMFVAIIPEISFWLIKFGASFFIGTAAIISVVGAVIAVHKEIGLHQDPKIELPEWTKESTSSS